MRYLFIMLFAFLPSLAAIADKTNTDLNGNGLKKRINFFVSSRVTKPDGATISTQLQAIATSIHSKGSLYLIVADSAFEMAEKIEKVLKRANGMIGNIWFDSHGHWSKRRSLFEVGKDEFNYHSLQDQYHIRPLLILSHYCDSGTQVGIGSCYGGATYNFPAVENIASTRMNGDSLMMKLSEILNGSTVFASESFVMSRIGIFSARYKLAGRPFRKRFQDPIYLPAWERLGSWNQYNGSTGTFSSVATVSINPRGEIFSKKKTFLSKRSKKKKQHRIIKKLKAGNYDLSWIYKEGVI